MHPSVDIAIITVLPEEFKALYQRLSNPRKAPSSVDHPNLYAWKLGKLPLPDSINSYSIALGITSRAGTSRGALATIDAINRWSPRYVFFVGIAGGFEEHGLRKGDVIIADLIFGYEYGKLEKSFRPRQDWTYHPDPALLSSAVAFSATNSDWIDNVGIDPPEKGIRPKALTGHIASGDKVVDDPSGEFFASVSNAWESIHAIEMEGVGAAIAIEQARSSGANVGFLMIRGISDIPRATNTDNVRGTQERDNWKAYAAATAAAFTASFISNSLPVPPEVIGSQTKDFVSIKDRLAKLNLLEDSSEMFGKSPFAEKLGYTGSFGEPLADADHWVLIGALPTHVVSPSDAQVLAAARDMLKLEKWYSSQGAVDALPKYWPPSIFEIPNTRRSAANAFFWEDVAHPLNVDLVLSRLAITGTADVIFASSIDFVRTLTNGVVVFRIAPILAKCWMFAGLVAQFYKSIDYFGGSNICIGMVNTENTHLGDFASSFLEPYDAGYWHDVARGSDWSCHSPNIGVCENVNLLELRPKIQPDFIKRLGEALSIRYNHDVPRCFDKETGLIPRRYFEKR